MSLRSRLYILAGAVLTWLSLHDIVALYQYNQYLQVGNGTETPRLTTNMTSPTLYAPKGLNPYITLAFGVLCLVVGVAARLWEKKKTTTTRAQPVAP